MSREVGCDDFMERVAREILAEVTRCETVAEATRFLKAVRAELSGYIEHTRREGRPELAEGYVRLLGRLHDETETGGTRS